MARSAVLLAGLICLSACVTTGCDEKSPPASPSNPKSIYGKSAKTARDVRDLAGGQQEQVGSQADQLTGQGNFIEVGNLMFPIPVAWQAQPKGGMRAAEYKITTADGEASCVFFTGIGGDTGANIERWKGQVKPDPGGEPKVTTATVDGFKVTQIDMVGTYSGMSASGGKSGPLPGVRFLGAIIEGPRGPIQIRLTGAAEVVDAVEGGWKALIFGLHQK